MFTGIIEEVGTVASIVRGAHSAVLTVEASVVLTDAHIGDSIAVNGVCLTVTSCDRARFSADVMHETLDRSSLGSLRAGSPVNLERAMAADGRFGGHIVSGHIDGTGSIERITRDDNAFWYRVSAGQSIVRYVVEKGSIAIDGISLTVARVDAAGFEVSIIPHTQAHTNLAAKSVGDVVNLECDIVGKYVEKMLGLAHGGAREDGVATQVEGQGARGATREFGDVAGGRQRGATQGGDEGLTWEFLAENGF